jgi:tetratricopeptide (TPR) repeat protein
MTDEFPDRREVLFGRIGDIGQLTDRATGEGLTVLKGRPLNGKTWVLQEVARELVAGGSHLVGYHEYRGGESSHLLYAVFDLYTRWLADSSMRSQALSLWHRHKSECIPAVGRSVGILFEKLGAFAGAGEGIGSLVSKMFDELSNSAKDLKTAGLSLAPLSYDQAASLVSLVAHVSRKTPILVMDAWEKTQAQAYECSVLETYLSRLTDWKQTHVFLGVRHPNPVVGGSNDLTWAHVRRLELTSPNVHVHDLDTMNLQDRAETTRLCLYIRKNVPAAESLCDTELIQLIAGYPGVINFWLSSANRLKMTGKSDLKAAAEAAQKIRYVEMPQLLEALPNNAKEIVAKTAMMPRLTSTNWIALQSLIMPEPDARTVDALVNSDLWETADPPSFGHDSRHAAARHWFARTETRYFRHVSLQMIALLASKCTSLGSAAMSHWEALAASSELERLVDFDEVAHFIVLSARSVLGDGAYVLSVDFERLFPVAVKRDARLIPLIAGALLTRSNLLNDKGDQAAALLGCDRVITIPGAPPEFAVRAFLLRGLIKMQRDDLRCAIDDFTAAIDLPDAPRRLVALALYSRGRVRFQQKDFSGARTDLTAAILEREASGDVVYPALNELGDVLVEQGELEAALIAHTGVIEKLPSTAVYRAQALVSRSKVKFHLGDLHGGVIDASAAIAIPGAPIDQMVTALINRGLMNGRLGNMTAAIADATSAIEMPGAPLESVALGFFNRGRAKDSLGDFAGAEADYSSAISAPGASPPHMVDALNNRGLLQRQRGDVAGALADFDAAVDMGGVSRELKAQALYNRGVTKSNQGDLDAAICDLTAVIELQAVPAVLICDALAARGVARAGKGDKAGAVADLTIVIGHPSSPPELKAKSLNNRAIVRYDLKDFVGAATDCAAVFRVQGAPTDQVTKATHNHAMVERAIAEQEEGQSAL